MRTKTTYYFMKGKPLCQMADVLLILCSKQPDINAE